MRKVEKEMNLPAIKQGNIDQNLGTFMYGKNVITLPMDELDKAVAFGNVDYKKDPDAFLERITFISSKFDAICWTSENSDSVSPAVHEMLHQFAMSFYANAIVVGEATRESLINTDGMAEAEIDNSLYEIAKTVFAEQESPLMPAVIQCRDKGFLPVVYKDTVFEVIGFIYEVELKKVSDLSEQTAMISYNARLGTFRMMFDAWDGEDESEQAKLTLVVAELAALYMSQSDQNLHELAGKKTLVLTEWISD